MKTLLIILSVAGLLLTLVPAFLLWYGTISWEQLNFYMAGGMVLWFATAAFWLGRRSDGSSSGSGSGSD